MVQRPTGSCQAAGVGFALYRAMALMFALPCPGRHRLWVDASSAAVGPRLSLVLHGSRVRAPLGAPVQVHIQQHLCFLPGVGGSLTSRLREDPPWHTGPRLGLTPLGGHPDRQVLFDRRGYPHGCQEEELPPQYRQDAAHLVINTGHTTAALAQEIGVGAQLLGRWVDRNGPG